MTVYVAHHGETIAPVPPLVILGLLLVYGVGVLALVGVIYLRFQCRPGKVFLAVLCVAAVILQALWHTSNTTISFSDVRSGSLEQYAQAVRMQALSAIGLTVVFVVFAAGLAGNKSPWRRAAIWAFAGMGFLALAVAVELGTFAAQLVAAPGSDFSAASLFSWLLVSMALLAGWLAYLKRPGERYPWYWYAMWMAAAAPIPPAWYYPPLATKEEQRPDSAQDDA